MISILASILLTKMGLSWKRIHNTWFRVLYLNVRRMCLTSNRNFQVLYRNVEVIWQFRFRFRFFIVSLLGQRPLQAYTVHNVWRIPGGQLWNQWFGLKFGYKWACKSIEFYQNRNNKADWVYRTEIWLVLLYSYIICFHHIVFGLIYFFILWFSLIFHCLKADFVYCPGDILATKYYWWFLLPDKFCKHWALFQYLIRRLIVRSREVSKLQDLYLELSGHSEILYRHLGSTAANVPVKFQSNVMI